MKLIENWREAPRMYSMWAFTSIATIQGSVLAFINPEQLAAAILFYPSMTWGGLVQAVIAFLAVTGGIGRLIYQPKKEAA
jgi:hypothetical protein